MIQSPTVWQEGPKVWLIPCLRAVYVSVGQSACIPTSRDKTGPEFYDTEMWCPVDMPV